MGKENVTAAKPKIGGAGSWAPAGTTLPEDATSTLGSAFKSLGYFDESGLVNQSSPESEQIKAWGGDFVLTSANGRPDKFVFTLIEVLDPEVLKVAHGDDNVEVTTPSGGGTLIAVAHNASDLGAHAWVFDMIMRDGALKRITIPSGTVESVGDITYADGTAAGYAITLNAEPDEDGNTHYEYIKK